MIKLVHHKHNVTQGLPSPIQKMERHLAEVIKPALPNTKTQDLIYANANNWSYTTIVILKYHYTDALKVELAELKKFPPQQWEACFNTATLWEKRGTGKHLRDKINHEAFLLT